jgi:hypothetical protein
MQAAGQQQVTDLVRDRAREHESRRHVVLRRFCLHSTIEDVRHLRPVRRPDRGAEHGAGMLLKTAGLVRDEDDVDFIRPVDVRFVRRQPLDGDADVAVDAHQLRLRLCDNRRRHARGVEEMNDDGDSDCVQHRPAIDSGEIDRRSRLPER